MIRAKQFLESLNTFEYATDAGVSGFAGAYYVPRRGWCDYVSFVGLQYGMKANYHKTLRSLLNENYDDLEPGIQELLNK